MYVHILPIKSVNKEILHCCMVFITSVQRTSQGLYLFLKLWNASSRQGAGNIYELPPKAVSYRTRGVLWYREVSGEKIFKAALCLNSERQRLSLAGAVTDCPHSG